MHSLLRHMTPAPSSLARTLSVQGAGVLGALAGGVLLQAVRSGRRGGPVAVGVQDIQHLLLAPLNVSAVLRSSLSRLVAVVSVTAVIVGVVIGAYAGGRFPLASSEWLVSVPVFLVCVGAAAIGTSMVVARFAVRRWILLLSAGVGAVLAVIDVRAHTSLFVGTWLARVALWPLNHSWTASLGVAFAFTMFALGLSQVGQIKVSALTTRSGEVRQLTFAIASNDWLSWTLMRTRLTYGSPRTRPWMPVRASHRFPVWSRCWRGIARWPYERIIRLIVLALVAGLALRFVASGFGIAVVAATLALFFAGLDAAEALAEATANIDNVRLIPVPEGRLEVRHMPVPFVVMSFVSVLAAATAWAFSGFSPQLIALLVVMALSAAVSSTAGVGQCLLREWRDPIDTNLVAPVEFVAGAMIQRYVWPFVIVAFGLAPAVAFGAIKNPAQRLPAAVGFGVAGVVVSASVMLGWVAWRRPVRRIVARLLSVPR